MSKLSGDVEIGGVVPVKRMEFALNASQAGRGV
jgi:hypothetical protein